MSVGPAPWWVAAVVLLLSALSEWREGREALTWVMDLRTGCSTEEDLRAPHEESEAWARIADALLRAVSDYSDVLPTEQDSPHDVRP